MYRTGPTRIPVFGPRIPIPVPANTTEKLTACQNSQQSQQQNQQQQPTVDTATIITPPRKKAIDEITAKDVGKKVRVADKEGILRFVGNVHFTTGVWCGVELASAVASAVGKNDGVVRGVRYFTCPASRGLMAPLSKVSLIDEIAEDAASGPYSMIFDANNDQLVNNAYRNNSRLQEETYEPDKTFRNNSRLQEETYEPDKTFSIKETRKPLLARSETFDISEQYPEEKIRNANNISFVQKKDSDHTTHIKCDTVVNSSICNDSVEDSGNKECNETIINISITKRGRVFNISHTDKEILNITPTNKVDATRRYDNVTFDVKSDRKSWLNTTILKETPNNKQRVPSDLNLRSFSCNETVILKNINESFDRPKSYPITENYFSPIKGNAQKNTHSAALQKEREITRRSQTVSPTNHNNIEDDNAKRDSLDCDESLGILTPDQMVDNLSCFLTSRSPSSENIPSLLNDVNIVMKYQKEADIASPIVVDSSLKDYSLGVIDVNEVSTLLSDTTMNMELPLDSDNNKKEFTLTRIEQTPSPEELPLDPTPMSVPSPEELPLDPTPMSVEDCVGSVLEPKTEPTQSKTTSNFITSITSITSIDTGYQGDGEMSRPASRGPDNSPLTRRPLARPQPRRPDPMTDSDFYTESDADNHDEHPLRGDRRAQVIDGTLYGVDPQAAADIYVNNRENMDSSGIFTDLESNIRTEELSSADNDIKPNQSIDVSPSDSSTKTISDNSQNNILIMPKTPASSIQSPDSKNVSDSTIKEISPKRHTPSPSTVTSSPTSVRSPRHTNKEDALKKYKMPKRNVASKVKAMMEPTTPQNVEKKTATKKPVGRWDAVMNKISKNQDQNKNVVKEIKSKVFATITTTSTIKIEPASKISSRPANNQKSPNNKLRRVRTRATTNTTPTKNNTTTNIESSIHSSLSDLSGASPIKKIGKEWWISEKAPRPTGKYKASSIIDFLGLLYFVPRPTGKYKASSIIDFLGLLYFVNIAVHFLYQMKKKAY
ncbi:CAP-Gly domain [Popillia japonica]|uniref:CAP-Gly domain n=1 Tax=Popillia japonica TaxID=7064 RepID=A0AAW1MNF3_POPJA